MENWGCHAWWLCVIPPTKSLGTRQRPRSNVDGSSESKALAAKPPHLNETETTKHFWLTVTPYACHCPGCRIASSVMVAIGGRA